MNTPQEIESDHQKTAPMSLNKDIDPEPFLKWEYEQNEITGKYSFKSIKLSDASELTPQNLRAAVKRATGSTDIAIGETILKKTAKGFTSSNYQDRLNSASELLPALCPQDATEAQLCGQFLALQDSGMECLRQAHLPQQGFYHEERLLGLASKLFNTANQTMQTLMKYRTRGNVTMQVVHVHNQEGKAIVTQNLSSNSNEAG